MKTDNNHGNRKEVIFALNKVNIIMPLKMLKFNILLLPLIFISGLTHGQDVDSLVLLFTGDIMGHDTQINSAWDPDSGKYNYDDVFRYVKPIFEVADVTIANFEVTLAGPPYKGYPQFSSPVQLAVACQNAGIDYFVLANNHVADRGGNGILSTINKLDSLGILHTGSYRNQSERDSLSPLIIKQKGFNLALLNYTYGTNGLKVPEPLIVDSLDAGLIAADISKAKIMNADAVILFLHWGTEYDTIPSRTQTELAAFLLDQGADLVIGSHPHVIQKMAWTKNNDGKDGIIVYSLGNFVSNQRKPRTDGGCMASIKLVKKEGKITISETGYYLTWVYTPVEDSKTRFYILPGSQFENNKQFFTDENDFLLMSRFLNDSRSLLNTQNNGIREFIYNESGWSIQNMAKNE
jgi:poly-gamma-glutamate synthesis protein (capsule biosynthesis protein)